MGWNPVKKWVVVDGEGSCCDYARRDVIRMGNKAGAPEGAVLGEREQAENL